MNKVNKLSGLSSGLLLLAAILVVASIFLPIWKIELHAPQYPEGLALLIYTNRLAGDVDIINGLNHYIGMQTLHTENFIEFVLMRYIFGFFALFMVVAALIRSKKLVYTLFASFLLFGILAMADFYRWNYNYGHNLDPSAAIQVPGMSYQPPLLGYKVLLNFGAYSIPDIGGLLFIGAGLLLLFVVLFERRVFDRWLKRKSVLVAVLISSGMMVFTACGPVGPKPIKLNVDMCAYCKMNIANEHFATQLVTAKGRHYTFDDLSCMVAYAKENNEQTVANYYVSDFCRPDDFIDVDQAFLLHSDSLRSPMTGNMAGFAVRDSAEHYKSRYGAKEITWEELTR